MYIITVLVTNDWRISKGQGVIFSKCRKFPVQGFKDCITGNVCDILKLKKV